MSDSSLQSTVGNCREYSIVVVNISDQIGVAVNTLAQSLFKKLKDIAANDPSLSVSIEDLRANQKESPSWAITAGSISNTKRYLLNEFCLPPTEGPRFIDYFVWASRSPVRAVHYLSSILRKRMGTGSSRQEARSLVSIFPRIVLLTVLLTALVLMYSYLMLFISFVVVKPLRRWRLWMVVLYFTAIVLTMFIFSWKSFVPPIVVWLSQITQQLLDLVHEHNTQLSFNLLFPVMATITIAVGMSILTFLIGWLRRAIPKVDAWMFTTQGAVDFAYLLDPFYAATAGGAFEKRLIEEGNKNESPCLFVVCEHTATLLAYEVLSRAYPGKINKPVHLLTHKLDLAGQSVDLDSGFWLLFEPTDWSRFAETTPCGLFWHHYSRRLWWSNEFTLRMDPTPQGSVPQVQYESVNKSWFKSPYSMLVDRLVALADQA